MSGKNRVVEHKTTILAPAEAAYHIIANVTDWPRIFPPTVHVEYVEQNENEERIQIWATANGEAKTWTSRRVLRPRELRVDFRQEKSQSPVAAMGGAWVIEPISEARSLVRLLHDYRAENDDPEKLSWLDKAVDRNSKAELAALKLNAELAAGAADPVLTFEDTVRIDGRVADVFDFINECQLWAERLPHVAKVVLTEDNPGLQLLEMDTRTKDGSTHSTKSVRVCFPHTRIAYKQIEVPLLMSVHIGQWIFVAGPDGVDATSRHTVVINEANVTKLLGDTAVMADAKKFVREALGTNSLTTLEHAKKYAETGN
ncbi:MAG: cyclase [Pseudonocardiales bacterium]|nr:MAG: cyclase [Pseudonocardiales bacterium]